MSSLKNLVAGETHTPETPGVSTVPQPGCFVAGTLVQTPDGAKPIESIQVGDLIAARDETTGETTFKPVLRLIHHENQDIVDVTLADGQGQQETIQATPDHPFHVHDRGWVQAGKLSAGDRVDRLDGTTLRVQRVEHDATRQSTYNFVVADVHTYFVGKLSAWVHNADLCVRNKLAIDLADANEEVRVARQSLGRANMQITRALNYLSNAKKGIFPLRQDWITIGNDADGTYQTFGTGRISKLPQKYWNDAISSTTATLNKWATIAVQQTDQLEAAEAKRAAAQQAFDNAVSEP